jgi:hypothetical protein
MDQNTTRGPREKAASIGTGTAIAALIVGSYLLAAGVAGLNAASSTGQRWAFGILFVIGVLVAGWAVILPWDGRSGRDGKHGE